MYMYVRQSENVYSIKFKYKLQTCKIKSSKTVFTDRLIPPFHRSNMQYEVTSLIKQPTNCYEF